MRERTRARRAAAIVVLCFTATVVEAREPGIAPLYPPGQSLGPAIAVPLPRGLYFGSRTSYYDALLMNNEGQPAGQHLSIASEALQITWVPGWEILGASYKMFVLAPFASVNQNRTYPLPPSMRGTASQIGAANLKFQFFDLSWSLGDGFYAATGISVYFPIGQWALNAPINIGANFWTFEPSLAFSYFKDGWNASLHALYDTNTVNPKNQYYSGDQLFLNATLTKNFEGFNIGPVSYYQKQVTNDYNHGGVGVFGGATALPTEQFALGGVISHQFDKIYIQLMYTQDIYARNAIQGSRVWLNLSYKIF
jgi:hypothetical protein